MIDLFEPGERVEIHPAAHKSADGASRSCKHFEISPSGTICGNVLTLKGKVSHGNDARLYLTLDEVLAADPVPVEGFDDGGF